jgi:hypothetical protein
MCVMNEMNWEMGSEFLRSVKPKGQAWWEKGPQKVKQSVGPIPVKLTPLELYTT